MRARSMFPMGLVLLLPAIAFGQEEGTYRDADGRWRSAAEEYRQGRRRPDYLRAAVESVGLFGVGVSHYWLRPAANAADWDDPDLVSRFDFSSVHFDGNLFNTNYLLHPIAGMGYYGLPRLNGLDPLEAALYVTLSSTIWEYVLEWREQVSINDLIVTPMGGIAMGEVAVQLSEYLTSGSGELGPGPRIAALTLGLPSTLHPRPRRSSDRPPPPPDALGLSSGIWHRFLLGVGGAQVGGNHQPAEHQLDLVAESEIVSVPGFLQPGTFHLVFGQGNFTEMRLRTSFSDRGLADVDLWFDANLAGYYEQSFTAAGPGRVRGAAGMVAFSSALRYVDRAVLGRRDQLGISHLGGLATRLWLASGDVLLRLGIEGHLDFGSPASLAYDSWVRQNSHEGLKSILLAQGYYYALGASALWRVEIEIAGLYAGVRLSAGSYDSIEGLDRWQARVTRDVPMADQIVEVGAWMAFGPEPVLLRLSLDDVSRWSHMGDVDSFLRTRRVGVLGLLVF